ncbi:hypothetical protein [Nonomuraea bangladeshensis]|uniref:hypothetical protein n=1 Tax=Nonomuraea bangladeshensis TaxID=404385 RepID=UPI003C2F397D
MSLVRAALRRASQWQRPLMLMVASMLLLLVVSAAGLVFADRMPSGAPVWLKLLKLAVSMAVYGTTLAWMFSLPTGAGGGPPGWPPSSPSPGSPPPPSSQPVTGPGARAGGRPRRDRCGHSGRRPHRPRRDRWFDHPHRPRLCGNLKAPYG